MRLEVKALKAAVRGIEKVVERRNTIPILSNVKLVGSKKSLRLVGTDLDVMYERVIGADAEAAFATTVSASSLVAIVGKLADSETLSLKLAKGKVEIVCGRARFSLPTLPEEDFPDLAPPADAVQFSLPAGTLLTMLDTVRFAASTEETRYYLNGVFLHHVDLGDRSVLRAAATDGHRLARTEVGAPEGSAELPDAIVSTKTVTLLCQMLAGVEDAVDLSFAAGRMTASVGAARLVAKLIDGAFPDYTRVIPQANDKRLHTYCEMLATAIDRVAVISTEKTRGVKLSLDENTATLEVRSPENGTATEELTVTYEAGPVAVGFNARYLLDVLRRIDGDEVELMLADSAAPVLVQSPAGGPTLFVVMPMRM